MRDSNVIAITGKGGSGKTIVSYLLAQQLITSGIYPLLIDADPTMSHLTRLLEHKPKETIETIRKRIVEVAAQKKEQENQNIAENIDSIVSQSIIETDQYSLLTMGNPESKGCFCATNVLLRNVIESVTQDFDTIIIDCEAGLEQIHRQVIGKLDYLIIVSDFSLRSIETAQFIAKSAKKLIIFEKIGSIILKK